MPKVKLYDNISAIINYNAKKVLNVRIEKYENNEYIVLLIAKEPRRIQL